MPRRRDSRQHARAEIAFCLARERDAKARPIACKGSGWLSSGAAHKSPDRWRQRMRLRPRARSGAPCRAAPRPRQRRNEPGLGETRNRRLGQHRDATGSFMRHTAARALSDRRRRNRRAAGATSEPRCRSTPRFSQRRPEVMTRSRRHSGRLTRLSACRARCLPSTGSPESRRPRGRRRAHEHRLIAGRDAGERERRFISQATTPAAGERPSILTSKRPQTAAGAFQALEHT